MFIYHMEHDQGFIQDFTLEGGHFFGIVNVCMQNNRHCANHAVWGHAPPEKNSCPETESGGFWQLADYPTLVLKLQRFNLYTGTRF